MVFSKERELVGAAVIFQDGAGIGFSRLGGKLLEIRYNAGRIDLGGGFLGFALCHKAAHIGHLAGAEVLHFKAVSVQGMGAQVHAHQFFFLLEHVHDVHLALVIRQGRALGLHFFHVSKQRNTAGEGIFLEEFSVADQLVNKEVSATAGLEVHTAFMTQAVQGAGEHQIFETLAVHTAGHPFHKIVNV